MICNIRLFAITLFTLAMYGCDSGSKPPPGSSGGSGSAGVSLPSGLFLKSAPANAKDVGEMVAAAKPGESIVIRGDIGGSEEPFVNQRAIMTIVDRKIKDCDEMGEKGHCKTPWDYCCEPRDSLRVNLASVQVVGADGKVMKTDLKGQGGLDPMRTVVIEGKVAAESTKDSLVINATGVFVEPRS